MLLKANLIGHVGADPETMFLDDGTQKTQFNVATSKGSGDKKETTWVRVVSWRKLAELSERYVRKGMLVYVTGNLSASPWLGKDGQARVTVEVNADEVKFLSRVENDETAVDDEEALF